MAFRGNQPNPRRVRRQRDRPVGQRVDATEFDLPGPLRYLGNRKLFIALTAIFAIAIVLSLLVGIIGMGTTPIGGEDQPPGLTGNEAADVPVGPTAEGGTPAPAPTPLTVKRYTAAPALAIDTSRKYTATIKTPKGDMQVELYPSDAPQSVNAFVFLARDGYYNGTPFMQVATYQDGSKFYAQAGDPTGTGLGTPGFSIKKETTTKPFVKGAVGMCGSSESSNGGQFFISFVNDPAVKGCTIFGQVTSGLNVLDSLTLLDVRNRGTTGDKIDSVVITES